MQQKQAALNVKEIKITYDKTSQSVPIGKKSQIWPNMKMSNNPTKYEVLIKQYLHSILDISAKYQHSLAPW